MVPGLIIKRLDNLIIKILTTLSVRDHLIAKVLSESASNKNNGALNDWLKFASFLVTKQTLASSHSIAITITVATDRPLAL